MNGLARAVGLTLILNLYGPTVSQSADLKAADADTCVAWKIMDDLSKTSFVLGWMLGVHGADTVTSEEILSKLWPKGHRVGSVQIEIDVACRQQENVNRGLMDVMMRIAARLNGLSTSAK